MTMPITRRSMLGTVGTLIAGAGLAPLFPSPVAAQQNYYALSPDWQINWKVHRTSSLATVTTVDGGVQVTTPDDPDTVDQNTIALWAKRIVKGNFEFAFTYEVTARLDVPGGSFAAFYFNTLGRGTTRYPKALPNWRNITPDDEIYARNARGLRFSFATNNPFQPDIHHKLRLRHFNRSSTLKLVQPATPQDYPFKTGIAYEVKVRRVGSRLTVTVVPDPASGEPVPPAFTWNKRSIGKWTNGYIGFRWRGQSALVTDTSLKRL